MGRTMKRFRQYAEPEDNNEPSADSAAASFSEQTGDSAPVWTRCLEEAKAVDDNLRELWNADLDSFLIFAALFSGILTAFLIEVRKGLQEDLQSKTNSLLEILIQDIRNNATQSSGINLPEFEPTESTRQVNTLWFLSLTFSLLGALAAMLAKGWVAHYPFSPQVPAQDACLRHRRHSSVVRWRLHSVISLIPALIHIAFALFFSGLVILLLEDDMRIGLLVLGCVSLAALAYLAVSFARIFDPDCPYMTPLSRGLTYLDKIFKRGHRETYDNVVKADVLGWLFWLTTCRGQIDPVIMAIAGLPESPMVQSTLLQRKIDGVVEQQLNGWLSIASKSKEGDPLMLQAYFDTFLRLTPSRPDMIFTVLDQLKDMDLDLLFLCVDILRKRSTSRLVQLGLIERKCIPRFADLLRRKDYKLQAVALRAIIGFSRSRELRDELSRTMFIPHLLALIDSEEEVVRTECVKTFATLVEHDDTRLTLVPYVPALLNFLEQGSWATAALVVAAICECAHLRSIVLARRGPHRLFSTLQAKSNSTKAAAGAQALQKLCQHDDVRSAAFDNTSAEHLMRVYVATSQPEVKVAFGDIVSNLDIHGVDIASALLVDDAVAELVSDVDDDYWQVGSGAVRALVALSKHGTVASYMIEGNAVQKVLYLLDHPHAADTSLNVVSILSNLVAFGGNNQEELCNKIIDWGCIPNLMQMIRSRNALEFSAPLDLLLRLTQDPKTKAQLVRAEAEQALSMPPHNLSTIARAQVMALVTALRVGGGE